MVNRAGISKDQGFEGMGAAMATVFVLSRKLIHFFNDSICSCFNL